MVISSFHWNELMQSRGVRRPSVCLSVRPSVCKLCANRFFYHKHDSIATKLAHDGPHVVLHPACAQGQGQGQRSRDTDTFLITLEPVSLSIISCAQCWACSAVSILLCVNAFTDRLVSHQADKISELLGLYQ